MDDDKLREERSESWSVDDQIVLLVSEGVLVVLSYYGFFSLSLKFSKFFERLYNKRGLCD
jgi:hypothetical protein